MILKCKMTTDVTEMPVCKAAQTDPALESQAIDRAHRIGQDKSVFVYRLVATGTIEEKMDELKARKRALADGLFDPEGRMASALTEDDVKALFEV